MLLSGCVGWNPPPIDLADGSWNVRRGQAVWHPANRDLELAGEYLGGASGPDRAFVQFSKSPLLLAEVRVASKRWKAAFPSLNRSFSGVGSPPSRLAWTQWIRVAQGNATADGWTFSGRLDGTWRLENSRTGEWMEGISDP